MFRLKSPCLNCPFRRGQGALFQLPAARLEEIGSASAFQCHKTFESEPQQCAGLMAVLHREGRPSQIMQLAQRLGALDPKELDPRGEAYASWSEVLAGHAQGEPLEAVRLNFRPVR